MCKQEFLARLRKGLSGLPQSDIAEWLAFYSEMIDDRIEEGYSEEEAVGQVGNVDVIAAQIIAETPLAKLVKEKMKPQKRRKAWEILLLVLGSPLWLSLLIAVLAVLLSVYASLWAVIISLWAAFGSLVGGALGGIGAGAGLALDGNGLTGMAMIGAGVVCAGLSVFLFYGCKAATKGTLFLTKKGAWGIKNCFINKEGAQ